MSGIIVQVSLVRKRNTGLEVLSDSHGVIIYTSFSVLNGPLNSFRRLYFLSGFVYLFYSQLGIIRI